MPVKIITENKDVSWLHIGAQMGNAHFIGFMILEIRIQQNDRLPTDFLYLLPKPTNCPGKRIPHFPIGPKMKAINIKTETCPTKDPFKR